MKKSESLVNRLQALAIFFRKSDIHKKSLITFIFLCFSLSNSVEAGADEDLPIMENAHDLCYETPVERGLLCILGICLLHKQTIPIRNQGGGELTDVQVISGKSGLLSLNLANFDCGVDDTSGFSHDCNYKDLLDPATGSLLLIDVDWLIALNLFNNVIFYNMPDYAIGDTHSIYNKSLLSVDLFDGGQNLYGTYIKNDTYYRGRIYGCSGEGGIVSSADIVDPLITGSNVSTYNAIYPDTNNSLKYIQTMVAGSPSRTVTGVHLDADGTAIPYNDDSTGLPYTIIPYLSNNTCSSTLENLIDPSTGQQMIIDIPDGSYSAQNTFRVPVNLSKTARLRMIFVNPTTLSSEGQSCLANSSTTGNFARVSQCANSEGQYVNAFGEGAWERCANNSGKPCLSQNNGYADPADPTFNPATDNIYENELGCYMCTFGTQLACSSDNFAIRPDRYELSISHADAPNLLRAGEQYSVSLTARYPENAVYPTTGNAIPSTQAVTNYDVVDLHNDLGIQTQKYFRNDEKDTTGALHGTADINASIAFHAVDGLSSLSTSGPVVTGVADEVANIYYNDVGKVSLQIYDPVWAAIDNDDTPMDCNSTAHTYICSYSNNVTFIPHHFAFADLNITNHRGPDHNVTYIAGPADRNLMSAKIQTKIQALNKLGNITQNFQADSGGHQFFENNISVLPQIIDLATFDSNGDGIYGDAHESNITNQKIGFGLGVRNILWDEGTYPLNFNFQRANNAPVNPFDVNGSYLSISIVSNYVDPEDNDTATIAGSRIGDQNSSTSCAADESCMEANADNNATFFYARARSSKFFYDDLTGSSVKTPISIVIYCDKYPTCTLLPTDIQNMGQVDEPHWWLAFDHNETAPHGDGNILLTVSSGSGNVNPTDATIIDDPIDETITVSSTTTTRPNVVEIKHNGTNRWLIYNPDSPTLAPDPFYKVRFIGQSGWAGHGDTGNVVDSNASRQKNKRLEW